MTTTPALCPLCQERTVPDGHRLCTTCAEHLPDEPYCRRHDLFDCPFAHDPREETAT